MGIPDIGKFLYKHIHSLHHKSYNPTAFSGTSMHFIEATVYFSAALQPVILGNLHPVMPLAWIISLALDAWLGHDGFQVISYVAMIISYCSYLYISPIFSGQEAPTIRIIYIINILIVILEQDIFLLITGSERLQKVTDIDMFFIYLRPIN